MAVEQDLWQGKAPEHGSGGRRAWFWSNQLDSTINVDLSADEKHKIIMLQTGTLRQFPVADKQCKQVDNASIYGDRQDAFCAMAMLVLHGHFYFSLQLPF